MKGPRDHEQLDRASSGAESPTPEKRAEPGGDHHGVRDRRAVHRRKDKACVEVCPVDCIYEGPSQLFIHPDECIDCGACEPVCPVMAIFAADEIPEQSRHFLEVNRQFFGDKPGVQACTTRN